jgi:hypothetical protein
MSTENEMKYQTITKWNQEGRTFLDVEQFANFQKALRNAKQECKWEFVIESIVVCNASNEVLWEESGDFQFLREA